MWCFVANCPFNKESNITMVSSRSQMNIRSGPASVVSAGPILFPLPLCLLPRLHGFAVATVNFVKSNRFFNFQVARIHAGVIAFQKHVERVEISLLFRFFRFKASSQTRFVSVSETAVTPPDRFPQNARLRQSKRYVSGVIPSMFAVSLAVRSLASCVVGSNVSADLVESSCTYEIRCN